MKRFGIALGALTLVAAIAVTLAGMLSAHHVPSSAPAATSIVQAAPVVSEVSSHMMFVGDVFWGRAIETAAQRSGTGPAYLFHGLTANDKKPFDAWIGDMECPVTDKDVPYRMQVDSLVFNCRPEYVSEVAKWFDVMTLANNHTDNNGGSWGLEQTRKNLGAAGIQYFGGYDMSLTSDICEIVSMPAHETTGGKKVMIPIALCGYDYVGNVTPSTAQMAVMQQYATVMPVIAMGHMGIEYLPVAEASKAITYRQLIDAGADAVIGAHPHVVQNSESYKGRLIAYSTGNFLFDQQILGRDTTLTLGVGIKLIVDDPQAVAAYEAVGSECKAYKDACLVQLQQKLVKRPKIQVAYDFQCFDESSGVDVHANEAVCNDISARATINELGSLSKEW